MIDFPQMMLRLAAALALGALMGLEREIVHKEAGIRTLMMVSGGSSIFAMITLVLPQIISPSQDQVINIIVNNGGFLAVIGNIVVGIGFLGAGIIIKTEERVHGLTTAAVVWVTGAIGILCGLGLTQFALAATVCIAGVLFLLRKTNLTDRFEQ